MIGVPDERWDERPLACVVLRRGRDASTSEELREFLADRVARWQAARARGPSSTRCPKTSVGKFDKKVLRAAPRGGRAGRRAELTGHC